MNLLQDILTYIRRIIKTPSNAQITDNLLIDYVNIFLLMDVDARIQLFDYKTKYQFTTVPGFDKYNMPLYDIQIEPGSQNIASFPVYQGFMEPAFINGVPISFSTQRQNFFTLFPQITQYSRIVATGDGVNATYSFSFPISPVNSTPINPPVQSLMRGHVDITGIIATGINQDPPLNSTLDTSIPTTSVDSAVFITTTDVNNAPMIIKDSGQFLDSNVNYGLLMNTVNAPGNTLGSNGVLPGGYSTTSNTVNYTNGTVNVTFPSVVPAGVNISAQCYFYQSGLPRSVLFYNNVLTLRTIPDTQYVVELDAYLTPAALLNTANPVSFGYMTEYIARGAARKILSDTGDVEQFQFYEPLFKEQEMLVWKRSQRQFTSTRTQTIYSLGVNQGGNTYTTYGGY